MRYMVLIALLAIGQQPENNEFYVKLKDGTLFSSQFELKSLAVTTDFGTLNIPLGEIKSIKASNEGFTVTTKKQKIEGKIAQKITFKTKHGVLNVKMDDVAEMVPAQKKIVHDDNVVGHWDFGGDEELKANGGQLVTEDGVSALKLDLSKGEYLEIPHKADFSQKQNVTVEIRFKFKDLNSDGNYITMLTKSERYGTGNDNYGILFWPSNQMAQIGSYTDNGQYPYVYPKLDIRAEKWHYLAVAWDAKNGTIEAYVDGKKVASHLQAPFNGGNLATNESSIFVCKDKFGNQNTIWFDFIRISNKTRTEEEIKELSEAGSLGSSIKSSTDKEYNTVIATKAGEKFTCKLEKEHIELESHFGDVKVDTTRIGKITFFDYRKDQIEKLHKRAKELIGKLSDEDPETREKAQDELAKMGWVVIPVLQENKDHKDEEVKSRVKKLLLQYEGKKYEIKKDLVEGKGLYLKGWVKYPVIKAKTRYGELIVSAEDMKALAFNPPEGEVEGNITISFSDGSRLGGKLSQEKIELVTDYGKMEIPLKDIISVTIGKETDEVLTRKSKSQGKIEQEEFELDSQIGKIKIKKTQISQITTGKGRIEGGNLALGAKVTGCTQNNMLVDGTFNSNNYAYCQNGQAMTVELKESYLLSAIGIFLYPDGRSCRYYIEVSSDGNNWKKVVDKQEGDHKGWQLDKFEPTPVKYIKLTGTHDSHGGGSFVVVEMEAYCNSENIRTPTMQHIEIIPDNFDKGGFELPKTKEMIELEHSLKKFLEKYE